LYLGNSYLGESGKVRGLARMPCSGVWCAAVVVCALARLALHLGASTAGLPCCGHQGTSCQTVASNQSRRAFRVLPGRLGLETSLALIPWGSYLFGCWLGGAATTAAGESGQVSALVGMPCNGAWCTAVVVVCVCVCVHLLDSPCTLEQAQRAFLAVPTRGKVARQLHPTNRGGAACCHGAWGWRRASGANPWGSYLLAWRRSNDCCRGSGEVSALVGMPCSVCCT